jgi:hypothetical protein
VEFRREGGWDFIAGSGWRDGVERGEEESRYGTGDDDGEGEAVAEERGSGDTEMRRRVMPLGVCLVGGRLGQTDPCTPSRFMMPYFLNIFLRISAQSHRIR